MIATALVVLGFITLLTTGIVIGVTHAETLIVFSTPIRADTRQVFVTGMITGLALIVAFWLLRNGIRRSRHRVAQLRRTRRQARHAVLANPSRDPRHRRGASAGVGSADQVEQAGSAGL